MEIPLIALAFLGLVVVPILAISAFVRVRHLERSSGPDPNMLKRLYALEQRLAQVERKLAETPPDVPALPVGAVEQASQTPVAPPPAQAAPTPAPTHVTSLESMLGVKERAGRLDLETLIAGRWLNRVGILALLFAVSFFIKYAFENNWVGPRGRVAIGLLLGSALLPWSQWLLRRGYRYFSEGIAGLGSAVLYLSLWSGWHYYNLFPQGAAFAGMIVVTAAMVALAVGRDSQRVALLALVGGCLTPLLVSTGRDQQVALFTYLGILDAGLLALARVRHWPILAPVSFFATSLFLGMVRAFLRRRETVADVAFRHALFLAVCGASGGTKPAGGAAHGQ